MYPKNNNGANIPPLPPSRDLWNSMTDFIPRPNPTSIPDLNDPTNRDTVPAMLTAGEYVLNKEAAQMYAPHVEAMNQHGLQQRHAENAQVAANMGGAIPMPMPASMMGAPVQHLNIGGWLSSLFQASPQSVIGQQQQQQQLIDDEEEKRRLAAQREQQEALNYIPPNSYGLASPSTVSEYSGAGAGRGMYPGGANPLPSEVPMPAAIPHPNPAALNAPQAPQFANAFDQNNKPLYELPDGTLTSDFNKTLTGQDYEQEAVNQAKDMIDPGAAIAAVNPISDEGLLHNSSHNKMLAANTAIHTVPSMDDTGFNAGPNTQGGADAYAQRALDEDLYRSQNDWIPFNESGPQRQLDLYNQSLESGVPPMNSEYGSSIPGEDLFFAQDVPQGQPTTYGASVPQSLSIEERKAAAANLGQIPEATDVVPKIETGNNHDWAMGVFQNPNATPEEVAEAQAIVSGNSEYVPEMAPQPTGNVDWNALQGVGTNMTYEEGQALNQQVQEMAVREQQNISDNIINKAQADAHNLQLKAERAAKEGNFQEANRLKLAAQDTIANAEREAAEQQKVTDKLKTKYADANEKSESAETEWFNNKTSSEIDKMNNNAIANGIDLEAKASEEAKLAAEQKASELIAANAEVQANALASGADQYRTSSFTNQEDMNAQLVKAGVKSSPEDTQVEKKVGGFLASTFGSAFKDLFGDNLQNTLSKALILYLGGRLTGMSGAQAMGLAAKSALADGENAKAEKKAAAEEEKALIKERRKLAQEQVAAGDLSGARAKKFVETGDLSYLSPEGGPAGVELGKHTQTLQVGGGVGKVEVYSNINGKGAYVVAPIPQADGTIVNAPIPLAQYRLQMENAGHTVDKWKDSVHDEQTITNHFSSIAEGEAAKQNTMNKNQWADKAKSVAINPQAIGQEAQALYFDWQGRRKFKDAGELKHNVDLAVADYVKAKNRFANDPKNNTDPASLEAFANRRLFKLESGLSFNNVANTSAKNYSLVRDTVMTNVQDADGNLVGRNDPRFAAELKTDWQDLNNLWAGAKKYGHASPWQKSAGFDPKTGKQDEPSGWDAQMLFTKALLDPGHPNHQQALLTQQKIAEAMNAKK